MSVRLLPKPQGAAPPRELEGAPASAAEFVICDHTIEFNFRDAKQHWGLEDFMNTTERTVRNAANLSLFMVNLVERVLQENRQRQGPVSVLDLKAHCRGVKYVEETLKLLPQRPQPVLLERIFSKIAAIGRIHALPIDPTPV